MADEFVERVAEALKGFSTPPEFTLQKFSDLEASVLALQEELSELKAEIASLNEE